MNQRIPPVMLGVGYPYMKQALSHYEAIIESAYDAIVSKTLDGMITSWNGGAERIFGFTSAEALGAPISIIIPTLYTPEESVLLQRVRDGKAVQHHETVRQHKDGRVLDISVSLSPIRNHLGEIVGASSIARNLNEESLRANQQLLDAIIRMLPVGLWIFDADGKIFFSNQSAKNIWAIPNRSNSNELPDYDAMHRARGIFPAIGEWASARTLSHGETVIEEEVEITCLDGEHKVILDSAIPILRADGTLRGAVVTHQDITGRKQTELSQKTLIEQLTRLNGELDGLVALQTAILDNAACAVIAADLDLTITSFNPAAEAMLGYLAAEIVGQTTPKIFHDAAEIAARAVQLSDELGTLIEPGLEVFVAKSRMGQVDASEWTYVRKDGTRSTVWLSITPLHDYKGAIVGYLGIAIDLTAIKSAEAALQESEARFRGAFESVPTGVVLVSARGDFMEVNPAFCAMLGYSEAELLKKDFHSITHPDDLAESLSMWADLIAGRTTSYQIEKRYFHKNLSVLQVSVTLFPVQDSNGVLLYFVARVLDVTEHRRAEAQLAKIEQELVESHELMRVTLNSIADSVITTDADGKVVWLNPVAEAMTGWSKAEAYQRPLAEIFVIINADTRQICQNPVEICLSENKVVALAGDTLLVSRTGVEFGIEDSASPIRTDEGHLLGSVLVFHDVSEQRRLTREMSYRASHDGLTGLVNRSEFDSRLSRLLQGGKALSHVMFYIDLDEFKVVNDTCGHDAGDQLLRHVSELLSAHVRARDSVARLGGDEFGVILERCSLAEGHQIAQKICDEIDLFRFSFDGRRFRIGASIGVVPIDQRWDSSTDVMKAADSCCYAAKQAGRHRVYLWEDSNSALQVRQSEAQWVHRLEQAMEEDQLVLYGQCIEPTKGHSTGLHCEVLLRLHGSDGKLILPGMFLPAAERFHLVSRIDRWVLRRVFAQLALADAGTDRIDMIAINLSGHSVGDRLFQRDVIRLIGEANFDIRKLCFEITETAAITNFVEAQRFIKEVRGFGVKIALDDFGAGASSFGYLRELVVDILKIDGQFITGLLENPLDNAAVRCFCDVANVIGAKTIAEFVERTDVRKALARIGVDMVQGFLIHRAEPLAGLLR